MRAMSATRRLLPALLLLACSGGSPGTSDTAGSDGSTGDTTGEGTTTSAQTSTASTTGAATSGSASASDGSSGATTVDPSAGSTAAETTSSSTTGVVDPCDPDPCDAPGPYCEGNVQVTPKVACEPDGEGFVCTSDEVTMDCGELACLDGACAPPLMPVAGEVIFVEMMQDPDKLSDFDAEWFELKNLGPLPVDLDGCRLADLGVNMDDHVLDAGGPLVILPGALMVMAKTVDPAKNGGIEGVAYGFGDAFSLTNTGDAAILRCDDVDVDVVSYESDGWPFGVGVAMGLDPALEDATMNDLAASWCAAKVEYTAGNTGSPGEPNPSCG